MGEPQDEFCILIVEDNDDLRMLYRRAMQMEGHSVRLAGNGLEGLETLRKVPVLPKVIILDLMMPVMDGWEFLQKRALDERFAAIPVIVCSASKEAIPEGVRFMRKPVDLDQLLEVASNYCS